MKQVELDQLTHATFSGLVKTRFLVQVEPAGEMELELSGVRKLDDGAQPNAGKRKGECFSLLFNGPPSRCLEQKIYTFKHAQIGQFSLFMVPIGKTPDGFQYEIVFNRLG